VGLAQLTGRRRPVVIRPLCRGGSDLAWPSRAVLASLNRLLGDYDLAEEALHEAFTAALEQWPRDGLAI